MKYTVVWRQSAEDRLGELWCAAADQQAIADVSDRIDKELKNDPERKVRAKDGLAFYHVAPLIVALEIVPQDRIVRVLNVDLF